jgi:hypothetical protein
VGRIGEAGRDGLDGPIEELLAAGVGAGQRGRPGDRPPDVLAQVGEQLVVTSGPGVEAVANELLVLLAVLLAVHGDGSVIRGR